MAMTKTRLDYKQNVTVEDIGYLTFQFIPSTEILQLQIV